MKRTLLTASIILYLLGAGRAAAHDTWILPERFQVPSGETVTVAMTSGMEFPENDVAVATDRLERRTVRLAGETAELAALEQEGFLALSAPLTEEGIAAVAVSSKPREIELTPGQAAEYLAEIGARPEVHKGWKELDAESFHETYAKHATSFVRVGDPAADRSWADSQGLTLEIVPLADPTRAAAGPFPVRVLFDGAPLPGLHLAAICEGRSGETHATTDSDGRAELELAAGRCLVKGVHLRRWEDGATDWRSDFATLTLEVR